ADVRARHELDRLEGALLDQDVVDVGQAGHGGVPRIEPQCADTELPVGVQAPGPDDRVAQNVCTPQSRRVEALRDVDAAALHQAGIDHPVVGDEVVVAAVDGDAVGKDRVLHGVVVERVVNVG